MTVIQHISLEDFDYYVNDCTYVSISFAHYSVHEYLDSNRTSNADFDYHAIGGGDLKDRYFEIILSEAQHVESNDLWNSATDFTQSSDVVQALCSRFNVYCVRTAMIFLLRFPGQICRHSTLSTLAIDLLDPSLPHYSTWKDVIYAIKYATTSSEVWHFHDEAFSRAVEWDPDTNTDIKHLHSLLLLTESCREYLTLVKTFLQGKDLKSLLQARLSFNKELSYRSPQIGAQRYSFEGSIIEVYAQLAPRSVDVFRFLTEVGAGLFDPSTALLFYMGSYDHSRHVIEDKGFCPLQRLLELGADPNLRGHRITPLQIATLLRDVEALKMLLKAGARPNDTGCPDGVGSLGERTLSCMA